MRWQICVLTVLWTRSKKWGKYIKSISDCNVTKWHSNLIKTRDEVKVENSGNEFSGI